MEHPTENPKADRIDKLLYVCAFFGVLTGIFQRAAGHYLRALVAAATFLVLIPWLGKTWINRSNESR